MPPLSVSIVPPGGCLTSQNLTTHKALAHTRPMNFTRLRRAALLALPVLALTGAGISQGQPVKALSAPVACSTPAPTTAAGYSSMIGAADRAAGGGSDVGVTVKVGSKTVWLWGDRFGIGPWTRSSAYVQDKGCITRSPGQLLPTRTTSHFGQADWYWPVSARYSNNGSYIYVTASMMECTATDCSWSYRETGRRVATIAVGSQATFAWWSATPPFERQTLLRKDGEAGNYPGWPWSTTVVRTDTGAAVITDLPAYPSATYASEPHFELPLASGKTLVTVARNGPEGYGLLYFEIAGLH